MKIRLDNLLVSRKLVESRSQAESYIRLGKVIVNGVKQTKPGFFVTGDAKINILQDTQYVSRAGLKLESVAQILKIDFRDKIVLDVGSSTGGFTDFALRNGAQKVLAVDVGTNQLHPKLRADSRVELHEKSRILVKI
jgi:23S rRNA (cytidine1920-2'-O)/16S rRNA (cytidine1409-2'-O)-methyltransferase